MNETRLQFSTYDLALASALVVSGFAISMLDRTNSVNRVSFIFDRSEGLDSAVQAFWSGNLKVDPKNYFDVLRHIKTRIYSEAS